jgi:succinate dehydrogenase (ubiquinone) membrane anchor subunit
MLRTAGITAKNRGLATFFFQQKASARHSSSLAAAAVARSGRQGVLAAGRWAASAATRPKAVAARAKSSAPSPLEADAGTMGTKIHHTLAHSMGILAPLYFFTPDSYTQGWMHKTMGVLLGANMGMHAWIGLNYVATDYVPKVSKALLAPSRYATAGVAVTILLGMVKIAAFSPGGIKGVVKGVWNGKPKDKFDF